jgi:D-alanyl-D-alanine carboxypeptidase
MLSQEVKATSTLVNVKMKTTAVELEGVTINVLGIEVKKNETASAFKSKEMFLPTGETSLLKAYLQKQREYRF